MPIPPLLGSPRDRLSSSPLSFRLGLGTQRADRVYPRHSRLRTLAPPSRHRLALTEVFLCACLVLPTPDP
jgi:hypothetical protein